jgi:hypothetical protein
MSFSGVGSHEVACCAHASASSGVWPVTINLRTKQAGSIHAAPRVRLHPVDDACGVVDQDVERVEVGVQQSIAPQSRCVVHIGSPALFGPFQRKIGALHLSEQSDSLDDLRDIVRPGCVICVPPVDMLEDQDVSPVGLDVPQQSRRGPNDIRVDHRFPLLRPDSWMVTAQALDEDLARWRCLAMRQSELRPSDTVCAVRTVPVRAWMALRRFSEKSSQRVRRSDTSVPRSLMGEGPPRAGA